jgi:putative ABC transport system substrate-binding protein
MKVVVVARLLDSRQPFPTEVRLRRIGLAVVLAVAVTLAPFVGHAQQPTIPVVGLLDSSSAAVWPFVAAFRTGLAEAGFVEGRNVRIEYRWAEGHYERLPGLAAELVRMPVAVLAATGVTAALAAKASTSTIPVVFHTGADPVKAGLVASLNKPGGNVTGVVSLNKILVPKQLELLHELVPKTEVIAFLVNPNNAVVRSDTSNMREAAQAKGVQLRIVEARNKTEIDTAFASLSQRRAGALIVQVDPFLDGQREQLAGLAARHAVPAMTAYPEFATVGGLISYGNSLSDSYRLEGNYAGRILKGERPADLPVQQSVKTELVINLKTAKALGLTIPQSLLLRADQVIE